jgi:hypothetical protein
VSIVQVPTGSTIDWHLVPGYYMFLHSFLHSFRELLLNRSANLPNVILDLTESLLAGNPRVLVALMKVLFTSTEVHKHQHILGRFATGALASTHVVGMLVHIHILSHSYTHTHTHTHTHIHTHSLSHSLTLSLMHAQPRSSGAFVSPTSRPSFSWQPCGLV